MVELLLNLIWIETWETWVFVQYLFGRIWAWNLRGPGQKWRVKTNEKLTVMEEGHLLIKFTSSTFKLFHLIVIILIEDQKVY